MSLDVYLTIEGSPALCGSGIYVREDGQTKEISRKEWDKRFPGRDPVVMNDPEDDHVFTANITHNLAPMAKRAFLYYPIWKPSTINIVKAELLIPRLIGGLKRLNENPQIYKNLDARNGWGTYDQFVPWIERYLNACIEYPDALVEVNA